MSRRITRLAIPILHPDEPCHECGDTAGEFIRNRGKHDLYECDTCTSIFAIPAGRESSI